jgi:hypothetical protein
MNSKPDDLVDLMLATADRIRSSQQSTADADLLLANALALLRRLPQVNGTISDDIRRQRELIAAHLERRRA